MEIILSYYINDLVNFFSFLLVHQFKIVVILAFLFSFCIFKSLFGVYSALNFQIPKESLLRKRDFQKSYLHSLMKLWQRAFMLRIYHKLGVVAYTFNPHSREAEAGRSLQVWGLHTKSWGFMPPKATYETLSQKSRQKHMEDSKSFQEGWWDGSKRACCCPWLMTWTVGLRLIW